jgi:MFS transporter, ACS family, hexuronate transporter
MPPRRRQGIRAPMPTLLSRPRAWALTLTATFTMAVSYVDRQTLAVLAPTVQARLHFSENAYAALVSAFALAYLVGAPLSGWLIDKVGARRGLLGAVLVWSAVAALHALAPGFGALLALRIALGLAEAPSFPSAAQTVQRALPLADQARGFGVLFTGSSFGAMVAPPLATYLESRWNFRVAFLGTALVGLSWVPLWLSVAYSREARAALDRPEAAKRDAAKRDAAKREERSPRAWEVMKAKAVLRGLLLVIGSTPIVTLFFAWGAKFLVTDRGLAQHAVGKYLVFPPLFFDVGSVFFGHVASRARARGVWGAKPELVAVAAALMLVVGVVPFMGGPAATTAAMSVSVMGAGGIFTLTTSDMMTRVPPERTAMVAGLCAAAQSIAQIAVSPLVGLSVTATGGYTQIMLALAGLAVMACAGWLLWRLPSPGQAAGASE